MYFTLSGCAIATADLTQWCALHLHVSEPVFASLLDRLELLEVNHPLRDCDLRLCLISLRDISRPVHFHGVRNLAVFGEGRYGTVLV